MTNDVRTTATNRVAIDAQRRTALTVGVLFVLTLVFAIPGVLAYGPVLNNPLYVLGPGAGLSVSLGAFFEILTVIANIATAMVLFPLLRRQNETLALSYVAARFIEAALIVVGMLSLLAVETLRQDGASADPASITPKRTAIPEAMTSGPPISPNIVRRRDSSPERYMR